VTEKEGLRRTVTLAGYKPGMSVDEQMRLGVTLGHEAYRDGVVDGNNEAETVAAVKGHTEMAVRMLQDGQTSFMDETIQRDITAYTKAGTDFAEYVKGNYDSSADYWRLVRREDGSYGVIKDGNHSLLDENGNVIVRSPLDKFDAEGNIVGHEIETENSYQRSFGMLMGLYTDFIQNGQTYAEYDAYVDAARANGSDAILRTGIAEAMRHTAEDGSIDVNAYLMTYKDVIQGIGIWQTMTRIPNGTVSYMTHVNIKNEYDEVVGSIWSEVWDGVANSTMDDVNYTMIENMIPEGRRLKAATFQFDSSGNVQMFGLGSTMPDPNRMGEVLPAIADGTYRHVTSLHNLSGDSYKALRLFDAITGANAGWSDVTGPLRTDATAVPGFNYTAKDKDNWGKYGGSLPGYYYDEKGNRVDSKVSAINAHKSNNNPFEGVVKDGKTIVNVGGSAGCQTWLPSVYDQIMQNQQYGTFGKFTINRAFFGDGTGGRNNYRNW
jgi:hypothetical protein